MSHDRGCFVCWEDPPYTHCRNVDCPKLSRGYYSAEACAARYAQWIEAPRLREEEHRKLALNFWRL